MSSAMHDFYLARAADAERDADAATLVNVRDRSLRSASIWSDLAARAARTETMRTRLIAEKAAERAAAPVTG